MQLFHNWFQALRLLMSKAYLAISNSLQVFRRRCFELFKA